MGSNTFADRADKFVAQHEKLIAPLERSVNLAWWDANVTGKDEAFQKKEAAQNAYDHALSDKTRFTELKAIREGLAKDASALLRRHIDVLYLTYLEKQLDAELLKKITAKANEVEKAFNVYRPKVNGRELTDSGIRSILKSSRDSKERQAAWEASKGVGPLVEKNLKELVLLRNQAAKKLGFANYHELMLFLSEETEEQVTSLFDELDTLTREPFLAAKKKSTRNWRKIPASR